jgi:hypothetical protein
VQEIIRDPGISGATIRYGCALYTLLLAMGMASLVKALLERGADPLSKDVRENTVTQVAMHLSLMSYFPDMRKAMVDPLTNKACPS